MTAFLILYVVLGLGFLGLAIPMIQRRVKPNPWYGFRVPKTLNNPTIWYEANAYSGRQLFRTGLTLILAAFALALIPGISRYAYAILVTIVLLADLLRGVVQSLLYLRKL